VPFPREGICELPWENIGKEGTGQNGRLYPLQNWENGSGGGKDRKNSSL
jgi:hypothetical protein